MRTFKNLIALMVIVLALTGCAELKDKFVMKKSEPVSPIKQIQTVRQYDVHPNIELYTKRYVFWKNWHRELLDVLTNINQKKRVIAIEQEVANLMDMQSMLVDEKALEMQKYVDELMEIEQRIKSERITLGNQVRIRRQLETIGRQVKANFSYRDMGMYIRSEFKRNAE